MKSKFTHKKGSSMTYKWPCITILMTAFLTQAFGEEQDSSLIAGRCKPACPKVEPVAPPPPMVCETSCTNILPVLEAKLGYFFFSDDEMSDIYNKGGLDVQLSASYPVWRWLEVYGSVEYLMRSGKDLGGGQETSIWEIPLSLGAKPVFTITDKIQYYVTLGPRYVFLHQHNDSPFIDHSLNQSAFGGFVNTGFNYFPMCHVSVDIFGEYSYVRMHGHPHKTNVYGASKQVGGFVFGGGLGYVF